MELKHTIEGNAAVVAVAGSVDALTATEVTKYLEGLVTQGHTNLVVDLGLVEYVSSAGLRTLLATLKSVRAVKGDLRLADVKPNVKKVLTMSGFTSIMQVFDTKEAALASFG